MVIGSFGGHGAVLLGRVEEGYLLLALTVCEQEGEINMANMMGMMKQAASMRKNMKKMQKQLARETVTYTWSEKIKVTARGDMTIQSITVDAGLLDESKQKEIEKGLTAAVNGALKEAKDKAGRQMSELTGGMEGLSQLLGK